MCLRIHGERLVVCVLLPHGIDVGLEIAAEGVLAVDDAVVVWAKDSKGLARGVLDDEVRPGHVVDFLLGDEAAFGVAEAIEAEAGDVVDFAACGRERDRDWHANEVDVGDVGEAFVGVVGQFAEVPEDVTVVQLA